MSLLRSLKLTAVGTVLLFCAALFAAEGPGIAATCSVTDVAALSPRQVQLTLHVQLKNHSKSDVTLSNLKVMGRMPGRFATQQASPSTVQVLARKTSEITQQLTISTAEYKAFQAGHPLRLSVTRQENGRMVTRRIPLALERGKGGTF